MPAAFDAATLRHSSLYRGLISTSAIAAACAIVAYTWATAAQALALSSSPSLARVSRAGWRLGLADRERVWALVSARAEGISIRALATAIGLSPARVHQLVAAGWPGCAGRGAR